VNLAIDIGQADIVVIHQGNPPDPGPTKSFGSVTANSADAADQDVAVAKLFQPSRADEQFGA
jgi:hypothetical protein